VPANRAAIPGPRWPGRLLVVILALGAGEVGAHSFQVGFLAPMSGPQAGSAKQALDGFMLATTERDSHPDEHSDGHLGGLDVYVRLVDTAQPVDVTRRLLRQMVREQQVEVMTGVTTAKLVEIVRQELAGTPAVLLAVDESRFNADDRADPAFEAAFRTEFGHSPSRAARLGYCIAQTIERAVRALGGDFSDPDRLAALFGEVGCRQ